MFDFSKHKVLVIGDGMVDVFLSGRIRGAATEAPSLIFEPDPVSTTTTSLGAAANVALSLKQLSVQSRLLSVVGDDSAGCELENQMHRKHLCASIYRDGQRLTTVKRRYLVGGQQVFRCDEESREPLSGDVLKEVLKELSDRLLEEPDAVIISDYGKGLLCSKVMDTILAARKHFKLLVVDPAAYPLSGYSYVDLITPSRREAQALCGSKVKLCEKLYAGFSRMVVLTNGGHGLEFYTRSEGVTSYGWEPARCKEPRCVVGAGDCVVVAVTLCLLAGLPLSEAAVVASQAVGKAVARPYTSYLKPEDFDQ